MPRLEAFADLLLGKETLLKADMHVQDALASAIQTMGDLPLAMRVLGKIRLVSLLLLLLAVRTKRDDIKLQASSATAL